MNDIRENLFRVRERIEKACARSGRAPDDVTLIGVTKTKPAEFVEEAIAAGIRDIGENKVMEAVAKKAQVSGKATWHLIGHLQRNKVRKALQNFDLIHSVDSLRLAEKIDQESGKLGKTTSVLLQVNTSRETSKFGVQLEDASTFAEQVASSYSNIVVKGLMTIGPLSPDQKLIRASFRALYALFDELGRRDFPRMEMKYLSMGMTNDFEIAIEENANMLRLGRVIFGDRAV